MRGKVNTGEDKQTGETNEAEQTVESDTGGDRQGLEV